MILVCTYANRKHDPDVVELVCAWDEFAVENNPEGWQKERDEALASWGDELLRWVDVDVAVNMRLINDVLIPQLTVAGEPKVVTASGPE